MQKIKRLFIIFFRVTVALKILHPDLPITFWSVSQEKDFSQIWDLQTLIIDEI